jgi:hypothetical protein
MKAGQYGITPFRLDFYIDQIAAVRAMVGRDCTAYNQYIGKLECIHSTSNFGLFDGETNGW